MSINTSWVSTFLAEHPVFRTEQFVAAAPSSEQTARDLLKYHRRRGHVRPIRTGMWHAPVAANDQPDPIAVAGCVAPDAIVALNAAMSAHGFGYSMFTSIVVYSKVRIRPFVVAGSHVRTLPHPRALVELDAATSATTELHRAGSRIRVTSSERSLVDMLDRQELSCGIEEIWRTSRQLGWIDDRELLPYLAQRASVTLTARVGFLLEHEPLVDVAPAALEELHRRVVAGGRGPWSFAPHVAGAATWDARWRLRVPEQALPRHWEEPTEW